MGAYQATGMFWMLAAVLSAVFTHPHISLLPGVGVLLGVAVLAGFVLGLGCLMQLSVKLRPVSAAVSVGWLGALAVVAATNLSALSLNLATIVMPAMVVAIAGLQARKIQPLPAPWVAPPDWNA